MPPQVFTCHHRISYAECTVGNHVYHSRFLDILERARGEFLRSLGCPMLRLQEQDTVFVVTECCLKYPGMARYDDELTVGLWLKELGRARWTCAGRISDGSGRLLVEADVRLACVTVEGRVRRMPEQLVGLLRPFLAAANAC